MARDPVCGMQVDESMAVATSVHEGRTYYFCATACKTAFDREPTAYLGGEDEAREGHMSIHAESGSASSTPEREAKRRKITVGVVAGLGVLLLILGIVGFRQLLAVDAVPPDLLGRRVIYTTVALFVSLVLIIWCLVSGLAWGGIKWRR